MTVSAPHSTRLRLESLEDREVPAIIFGVTASSQLVTFDSANPTVLLSSLPIVGFFAAGEFIRDIDVRPGNGQLYGRSNFDRLFLINPTNPLAIPIGNASPIIPAQLGMDFDPRNDQIRLWTNLRENVVLNSVTGSIERFGLPLSYVPGDPFQGTAPRVTGLAFVNSVPAATFTGVYAIDHFRNTLVQPGSQSLNDGRLSTVGGLGLEVGPRLGFDIAPFTNAAFASFQISGQGISRLYSINLGTGPRNRAGSHWSRPHIERHRRRPAWNVRLHFRSRVQRSAAAGYIQHRLRLSRIHVNVSFGDLAGRNDDYYRRFVLRRADRALVCR